MADTTVKQYPDTPAAVAAAILDSIERHPDAFDMDSWFGIATGSRVSPGHVPTCGTTLCAAGWAAHVTGWTLVDNPAALVTRTRSNGEQYVKYMAVYAEKDGERRAIPDIARDALGLSETQTFWYDTEPNALSRLRQIAGR
ncbi:hypothetical protein [Streptomyces sp. Amel2xC10]|uniref:hypothetical protein n=1 Tax=Streptomyces sp. Amel2xC10 TaxID=1305826 RepID=UPI000A08384F|nr:hypothetical protein [Streptomyces sp. Amel2xC10]SMF86465.1 hypothetical protein SAMN02745830_07176 [Streptomyces sp. Amel2xC10]